MSDADGSAGHKGKPAPAVVRKGAAGRTIGVVTIHRERPPHEGECLNGARVLRVARWGRCRYEADLDNGRRIVVLTGRPPHVALNTVPILEDPYA